MPEKPFIAARIPEDLNQALTQHVEESGLNRTEVIVNALVAYLKLPTSFTQGNKSSTRLDLLEERIVNLEKIAGIQNSTSNLIIESEKSSLLKNYEEETNHEEIKILGTIKDCHQREPEEVTLSLFDVNSEELTHKELSALTGISYNTIKSKIRAQGAEIKHDEKIYVPTKVGNKVYWITKKPADTNIEDTIEF